MRDFPYAYGKLRGTAGKFKSAFVLGMRRKESTRLLIQVFVGAVTQKRRLVLRQFLFEIARP